MTTPIPDFNIIEGLKNGGPQRPAFERTLYQTFFYFIKQGVFKYGIDEEYAASCYSDTIISVIHNIVEGKFEGRSALKSYCYQIFSNKCVDHLRKETTNKRQVYQTTSIDSLVFELPDGARNVVQQIIAKEQWAGITQKLQELGDKCREILLYFEDGYSDKDIAGFMLYNSADVVKTSRLRCLEKLRKMMNIKQSL
ncbi:RNA polymerase sigma-70 factor, ECF subfamily [Pedobacter westerhofensis]|uniref:RNA polymerase sigma-70 factor, ECF subfamily n=1 Tax=Pedobacter westerhofensis TaxID=425512 RepID=A0A521CSE4_9SPHI|nr:sigma-70 family RNA polymerase sigma factor [Pedobacter westerhofensis]SMO62373.1 RNA polymerase sigma-70 factor, ECF subfamily [Pedobacter westerhofensis]